MIVLDFFCLLLCIETKILVLRTLLIDALVCVACIWLLYFFRVLGKFYIGINEQRWFRTC